MLVIITCLKPESGKGTNFGPEGPHPSVRFPVLYPRGARQIEVVRLNNITYLLYLVVISYQ